MYIQYITIENFGAVSFYHADLGKDVNLLDSLYNDEIAAALRLLLCNKPLPAMPPAWLRENTRISAAICLENIIYCVCVQPVSGRLQLSVTDPAGADAKEKYQYILSRCVEQNAVETFDGQDSTTPLRLHQYWCREAADLSDRTNGMTENHTFRSYLHRYIRDFIPEPINPPKGYQIAIDPRGKFTVQSPQFSKPFLSETEEKLFRYLCFLCVAEFWAGFEKIRNLHHEKKPLLIRNFAEFLDQSADISKLIARTKKLQRQIIFIVKSEV